MEGSLNFSRPHISDSNGSFLNIEGNPSHVIRLKLVLVIFQNKFYVMLVKLLPSREGCQKDIFTTHLTPWTIDTSPRKEVMTIQFQS